MTANKSFAAYLDKQPAPRSVLSNAAQMSLTLRHSKVV